MEEYYQKVIKLQELLRQSEEERLNLEMKFNDTLQLMKQEEEVHMKKFKSKYKKFMDEDRKRQQRNDKILETLDRIENRTTMWESKTEKFKTCRKRYQDYLSNLQEYKNRNLADRNDTKVLDDFLPKEEEYVKPSEKILPQDYQDDPIRRKVLDNSEHLKKYSNLGNINSIYSRLPREKSSYGGDLNSTEIKNTKDYANILTQNIDTVARDVALDDYLDRPSSTYPYNSYSTDFTSGSKFTSAMDLVKDDDSFEKNPMKKSEPNSFYQSSYLNKTNENAPQFSNINSQSNFPKSNQKEEFKPSYLSNLPQDNLEFNKSSDENELKTQQNGKFKNVEEEQFISKPLVQKYEDNVQILKQEPKIVKAAGDEFKQPISPIAQPRLSQPFQKEQFLQNSKVLPPNTELRQIQQRDLEEKSPLQQYTNVGKRVSIVDENKQFVRQSDENRTQELDGNKQPDTYEQTIQQYNEVKKDLQQQNDLEQPIQQSVVSEHVEQQQYDETGQNLQQEGERGQPLQQYHQNEQPSDDNVPLVQHYDEKMPHDVNREALQQQMDVHGQPLQQQYDESGQLLQSQYDENGQPLQQYNESGQYDENGQLLQQYDEHGQPLQQYDANGQPLQQYDENGQPLQQYDANGQLLQQYDESGQPLQQYDESGQPLQQYDENGQPLQQYDANGQPLQQYDGSGQPLQQYDENGQPLQQYDANGQPLQQYDESGQPLQQYDENGQPLQQYDENGQLLQQYDESGQPLQQYDENGQPLQQYDENGQPLQQYDANGQPFQQYDQSQYDENGQLIQQYDENGQPLQYDPSGQVYQQYDENGQPLQYDPNGQLYQQCDENGQPIQQYDQTGQLDDSSKPKQNVLEMLETDTESFQQESKISNDSDFDISNTA